MDIEQSHHQYDISHRHRHHRHFLYASSDTEYGDIDDDEGDNRSEMLFIPLSKALMKPVTISLFLGLGPNQSIIRIAEDPRNTDCSNEQSQGSSLRILTA